MKEQKPRRSRTAANHRNHRKRRQKYLDGYGGRCACCGESNLEFLAVHHIDGGGEKERKAAGKGSNLVREKIRLRFPPGLQVLCCNCHQAIGKYGSCPHQKTAETTVQNLLTSALALARNARVRLVGELIASLEPPFKIKYWKEWEAEIEDRIQAYDRGEVKAYSREEVMKLLERDS